MIPLFKVSMSEDAIAKSSEVLQCGHITEGPRVKEFESNLAKKIGNDFVCTVNSATSGLHLSLDVLRRSNFICDGDEVLTTPLTCTATNWPILANNMKIKWVDIDPRTLNVDLDDLARKITHKTKAIMVVHWGGYPVDLEKLGEIQDRAESLYGFRPIVIEDCAHAWGSTFDGKVLGNHGNICVFSFQAIKHLTSVDGGAIVFPKKDLQDKAKLMRWYGIDRETNKKRFRCEDDIAEWGYKFHMSDVNASIGNENLKYVGENVKKHQENALFYDERLKDVSGITLLERSKNRTSSFWIYSMLVENRSEFMKAMDDKRIMVSQVHERNDKHSCIKKYKTLLPNLEKTIGNVISIPVGWWVTEEQREYIVNCMKSGW